MTITLELSPEIEERFLAEARARGLSIEDCLRAFLMEHTAGDWEREFRAWAESHDRATPPLSDEAVSRESIYGEVGIPSTQQSAIQSAL